MKFLEKKPKNGAKHGLLNEKNFEKKAEREWRHQWFSTYLSHILSCVRGIGSEFVDVPNQVPTLARDRVQLVQFIIDDARSVRYVQLYACEENAKKPLRREKFFVLIFFVAFSAKGISCQKIFICFICFIVFFLLFKLTQWFKSDSDDIGVMKYVLWRKFRRIVALFQR